MIDGDDGAGCLGCSAVHDHFSCSFPMRAGTDRGATSQVSLARGEASTDKCSPSILCNELQ